MVIPEVGLDDDHCRSLPAELFNQEIIEMCQDSWLKSQCFFSFVRLQFVISKKLQDVHSILSGLQFLDTVDHLKVPYQQTHCTDFSLICTCFTSMDHTNMHCWTEWWLSMVRGWLCHVSQDNRFCCILKAKKKSY